MPATLNFFDTYFLMAINEEVVPRPSFFKDRYFPTGAGDIFASDKVLTEFRKGDRKMAAFVSQRVGDIPIARRGYAIHEYQPAFIAPSRLLTLDELNKRFFTYHRQHRPYVILKWAQTADGYMDIDRQEQPDGKYWITRPETGVLVHKWRSEEQAILIGYRTYLNDRPQLTTRHYPGKNPQRYITTRDPENTPPVEGFTLLPEEPAEVLQQLYDSKIQSVIVEGGRKTLERFIASGLWDEARILTSPVRWGRGTPAPEIEGDSVSELMIAGDRVQILKNH